MPPVADRPRLPGSARFIAWLVISGAGLFLSLQLLFLAIDMARPLIGPIPDDSLKERMLVAGSYGIWFGLSTVISAAAWRRLLR